MKPADLVQRNASAWQTAIRHPFIDSVREGMLAQQSFATWLVQYYLLVEDKITGQAHLLPSAPRFARNLLVRNIAALEAELTWLEAQAKKGKLSLDAARSPVTKAYGAFMRTFEQFPFAAALTTIWAIERATLQAWQSALPGEPRYQEYIAHWTNASFANSVNELEQASARALEAGTAEKEADVAFLVVTTLTRQFWDMALSGLAGFSFPDFDS